MSKYTPGPWHVTEEADDDGDVLYSIEADNLPVADIYRKAEHEANARLIAAAPEMLELLQSIVNDYNADADIAGEEDAEMLLDAFRQIHKEASRLAAKVAGETK